MQIETLVNLTEGTLTNTPHIVAVESATVYPSKVEQGDLFFGETQESIDKAVENGAYAVVYADDTIVKKDEEIAWIRVDDVREAALRLLRYVATQKEVRFRIAEAHELSFVKMLASDKRNFAILPNDWHKAFEMILHSSVPLFIGEDATLLRTVSPDAERLKEEAKGYIIADTLFRTTFKALGYVYQERELTPIHFEYLMRALAFMEKESIPYSMDRLRYTKHFVPVFIDGNLNTMRMGQSDKVAVFVDNIEDIREASEYIRHASVWVKSIVLTPPKTKIPDIERTLWYENEEEIRAILKRSHYNYAFIYNADKSVLQSFKESYTLF